jgi:hypothetical protein
MIWKKVQELRVKIYSKRYKIICVNSRSSLVVEAFLVQYLSYFFQMCLTIKASHCYYYDYYKIPIPVQNIRPRNIPADNQLPSVKQRVTPNCSVLVRFWSFIPQFQLFISDRCTICVCQIDEVNWFYDEIYYLWLLLVVLNFQSRIISTKW